jgi:glycosyltransferase involved in cell wall biosynthesis
MRSREPYVSVCVITYNQKDLIKKSVESALNQVTAFPYEIVVGDDCSTDGTREILKELKEQNPEKLVLNLLPEKGKGIPGKENFLTTLALCRGKYTAFLDGDDYWTDEHKLQKQADFLDNNPDYSMCHHDCKVNKEYESNVKYIFNKKHVITGFTEACQINFAFYFSVMYRREAIKDVDLRYWLGDLFMGDWPLWCILTARGKSFFINEKMGYYKPHGLSRIPHDTYTSVRVRFFNRLLENNFYPDRKFLNRLLSRYYLLSAGDYIQKRSFIKALSDIFGSIGSGIKGIGKGRYNWLERLKMKNILKYFVYSIAGALKGKAA